jgi:adenylate cyclase
VSTSEEQSIDFAAEGLLDGLEGEAREERLALLEYLADTGVPLEELRRASHENTLMFLAAERVIGGPARYNRQEAIERTGVDEPFLDALRQAMGMPRPDPEERVFTEHHIEALRLGEQARQSGVTEEEILDVTRVLGRGLAHAAEVMRVITLRLVLEPGLSERELAERFAQAAENLGPITEPLVGHLLAMRLLQMAQTEAISAAERIGGELPGSREVTVCFADLVGFTRMGEEVPVDELGRLVARLESITAETIEPPIALVKTIGDAVMLVSPEPAGLVGAALRLIDRAQAEGENFPQLRAGVALGAALRRAGDWYGQPVNLASRVTGIARPGSVLCTEEVHDAAEEDFRWSFAGERKIKGVRHAVALSRARPLDADAEGQGEEDNKKQPRRPRRRAKD